MTFGRISDGPSLSRPIISFGWTFGRTSDGPSSSRPIISFGRTLGRTSDRPSSCHPIISFGRTFERTSDGPSSFLFNQTLRTEFHTDQISVSSNQILWSVMGRNPQENQIIRWSWTTRVTRSRSPSLSMTRHSNDLRSHERDGGNRRKKSPRAKTVQSRTY